ncbi:DUF3923 family protein [Terribacillus saccharophilus]|uniref:DUF3923 family protein n=1 Tax=Terribacillus saccharophilus TaxID=361277 RepID=UPI000BA55259|nr:DUF3923 family protein [Terribacillus saccharophilus]PAF15737.1 hypothetical protein CHH51_18400 [Terribacillus saccharophilus]
MKISWIAWWIVNTIVFMALIVGSIFAWTRSEDGAGVEQTYEAKIIAFVVLLVAFVIPLAIQIIWMIINLLITNNQK